LGKDKLEEIRMKLVRYFLRQKINFHNH